MRYHPLSNPAIAYVWDVSDDYDEPTYTALKKNGLTDLSAKHVARIKSWARDDDSFALELFTAFMFGDQPRNVQEIVADALDYKGHRLTMLNALVLPFYGPFMPLYMPYQEMKLSSMSLFGNKLFQ